MRRECLAKLVVGGLFLLPFGWVLYDLLARHGSDIISRTMGVLG